ncbi:DedA family inner membrane protein YohD [Klebsiella pneumoniae]|uniref:DedA family inner membrane protein YohD n=1 Tax=Klebsiella pneumoniae TaxID=573 RepID=A0A378G1M6_KLEPN|nr:DedA family inner membrane protein YohD [Klebsiella pneumoniae]
MYGFRVIGPLLIGASRLPPRIFLPLNIVGALVWALLFTTIGYLGGEVVGPWLHHLDAHLKQLDLADPRGGGWPPTGGSGGAKVRRKTKRRARGRTVVGGYFTVWW